MHDLSDCCASLNCPTVSLEIVAKLRCPVKAPNEAVAEDKQVISIFTRAPAMAVLVPLRSRRPNDHNTRVCIAHYFSERPTQESPCWREAFPISKQHEIVFSVAQLVQYLLTSGTLPYDRAYDGAVLAHIFAQG